MQDVRGKRVTVAGLGHFGGGPAVARWLVEQGATVLVTDRDPAEKLSDSIEKLQGLPIDFHLGGHRESDFTQTDLVVASPAIAPANAFLQTARRAGVPVTTEIRLFVERCRARRVIGVTGTKGKSTTTALLGRMLAQKHITWIGGNIGRSLLADLSAIQPDHVVVLELSSYMLDHLGQARWSPHVALVNLIVPDHLEWHGGLDTYIEAKRNIVRFQKRTDYAALCESSAAAMTFARQTAANVIRFGTADRKAFELALPGKHNQLNAQGAFAAASVLGVSWEEAQDAIRNFPGLPHRLQLVHERDGVRYFNDSIATIPEAAVAALEAFEPNRVIQIVGGSDKHLPMDALCEALASRAKAVLAIGITGPTIATGIRAHDGETKVHECGDLARALATAARLAARGDVVLLSTGCASYDQFVNFEDRGEQFARLVKDQKVDRSPTGSR